MPKAVLSEKSRAKVILARPTFATLRRNNLPMDSSAEKGYVITRYYHVIKGPAMATSLKIDDGLKSRVQQLASQRRRSAHWIMLEAIQQYVDREEARESFKQEAVASWEAYKETGRHLTGQEVRTWLTTWGSEDEKAMPECHK